MIAAILSLVGLILGFAIRAIYRKWERDDDPIHQHKVRYEQAERDISSGNQNSATVHGGSDLDELDRLLDGKGGSGGPAGDKSSEGATIHP